MERVDDLMIEICFYDVLSKTMGSVHGVLVFDTGLSAPGTALRDRIL